MINRLIYIFLMMGIASPVYSQYWWHNYKSLKADTSDASFIRPSDWNASLKPFPESSVFISDDFLVGNQTSTVIGELNWSTVMGGSGVLGLIPGQANHPGICTLSTGTTANASAGILLSSTSTTKIVYGAEFFDITFIVKLAHDTSENNYRVRVGLVDNAAITSDPADMIAFQRLQADDNWFGTTRSAGGTIFRTSAMTLATANWFRLRMKKYDYTTPATDSIGFSINGGTEQRLGVGITADTLLVALQIGNNNTAAAKNLYIDYFSLGIYPITRWPQ